MTWTSDRKYYDDVDRWRREDQQRQETWRRLNESRSDDGPRRAGPPSEPMPLVRIVVGLFLSSALIYAAFDRRDQGVGFVIFCLVLSLASLLLVRSGVRLLRDQTKDDAPLRPWKARAFWGCLLLAFCGFGALSFLAGGVDKKSTDAALGAALVAGVGALLLVSALVRRRRWLKKASP